MQLVSPVLYNQMLGETSKLQQSGRSVDWKMVRAPTLKDVKLVNGFVEK